MIDVGRSIKLKAAVSAPASSIEACQALGDEDTGTISQRGSYFEVPCGGLKLREDVGYATQLKACGPATIPAALTV